MTKDSKVIWKDKGPIAKNNNSVLWSRGRQTGWWNLTSKRIVHGPIALMALPVSLLEIQNLRPYPTPDQLSYNLFYQDNPEDLGKHGFNELLWDNW